MPVLPALSSSHIRPCSCCAVHHTVSIDGLCIMSNAILNFKVYSGDQTGHSYTNPYKL